MNKGHKCSSVRKVVSGYKGQGGFGNVIVPGGGGGGAFKPFDPAATDAYVRNWNGGKGLAEGNLPGYESRLGMARAAGPAVAAYIGALKIGELGKGIKNYFKELKGETDSYNKAGELSERLRQQIIAKRKKK